VDEHGYGRDGDDEVGGDARDASATGTPPRIEMTAFARSRISPATSSSWAGLWQRTTASAASATYALLPGASPPSSAASASARA